MRTGTAGLCIIALIGATAVAVSIDATTAGASRPSATAASAAAPGTFTAIGPQRLLDTRTGVGGSTPGARRTVALQATGRGGVPVDHVSAVVLTVTAVAPRTSGFVSAYADGSPRPAASNLNLTPGRTVSNLVVAPVNPDTGKVALYNGSTSPLALAADVSGYYADGTPTLAGAFRSLTPARILDTRTNVGGSTPGARGTVRLAVAGRGGVPSSGASAVVLNVTAHRPTSGGYVTVYGGGGSRPAASNINFAAGETIPNAVVAPLGEDGTVTLYNGSTGSTPLIVDIAGYFLPGTATAKGTFTVQTAQRRLDTRRSIGATRLDGGRDLSLAIQCTAGAGLCPTGPGADPANTAALVMNVTATNAGSSGYVEAWRAEPGAIRPAASNVNFSPRRTVSTLSVAEVNTAGDVTLHNGSSAPVDLLADVAGYYNLGTKGSMIGTVTDAGNGSGVPGVSVTVDDSSPDPVGAAKTGPRGRYVINNVAPGTYRVCLTVDDRVNMSVTGGYQPTGCTTTAVAVSAGNVTSVDRTLQPGGAISGTLTLNPAVDTKYYAYAGAAFFDSSGAYVTSGVIDYDGSYTVFGLPADDYTVCFVGIEAGESEPGYAPECYDNKPWDGDKDHLPTGTTSVSVEVRRDHTGIDATQSPAR